MRYLRDRHVFRTLRAFNVLEAMNNAPELRQLDASIAAAERSLLQARRSFFVPEVGAEARLDRRLHEGGAGADEPRGFDEWDWQVGVQATLPLFSGGARSAARARAQADLLELRERRRAAVLRIDQRVRSTMHRAGASLAAIDLARQAAEAARESMDLVSDAYARGVVSIIELLDAQNAAFVAELTAANALYQFMLDLMEVERAVGRFGFFVTSEDREAYIRRLETFARREAEQAQEESR
jgi:outer membrane protein TolC